MSILPNKKIEEYLANFSTNKDEKLVQLEAYAKEQKVPIMEERALSVMLHILKLHQPNKILEIGAAIGYSAIRMAKALPNTKIVTIEIDPHRFELAEQNIRACGLENQITIYHGDALEIVQEVKLDGPFDALFIDASKGQYKRFFQAYEPLLSKRAVVFSDNVLFKGLVAEEMIESKRLKSLAKKIKEYNEWLMNQSDWDTVIIPIGDGLAFSIKRGEGE